MNQLSSSLVLFIIAVVFVVKGGDFFVDAASWIARSFGIPSFIIGATIVSIATTMPEMIVSVMAAADGKVDVAVGNAVGSVTVNTGLIMALSILFLDIRVKRKDCWIPCVLLAASAFTLKLTTLGGSLRFRACSLLLAIFIVFLFNNIQSAKKQPDENEVIKPLNKRLLMLNILLFLLGAAGIVGGSQLLVNAGSNIASELGVPERIVAVTLIAIGTSLPEFVTTVTAIVKKESNLSVGNILGANIIDLTLILPMCNIVSGKSIPVTGAAAIMDIPACLGIILLAVIPMLLWQRAFKWQGILMLACYTLYLVALI